MDNNTHDKLEGLLAADVTPEDDSISPAYLKGEAALGEHVEVSDDENESWTYKEADSRQLEDEDYDLTNEDTITKPSSTKSKIVVNLEKDDEKGTYKYILDPYDEVRMKLFKRHQKLFQLYDFTIKTLQNNVDLQPSRRKIPKL
jgi:hypothetical protein